MSTEHDPYEARLGFTVKPEKGDFIGREALLRRKAEGMRRKLGCLVLDDSNVTVMGSESVYHDGEAVGYVTSAAYGYSVGRGIAYGYLPTELAVEGTSLEVEYFGDRLAATVAAEPLWDPKGERLRA
jgi:glycine cleavage system aminomethyltransferase T